MLQAKFEFMSIGKRLFWVTRILILNLLLCIAISWRLWFEFEGLPQIPLFNFLPTLLPLVQKITLGITIAYLIAVFLYPKSRLPLGIGVLLLILVGIQDWNRIQPWFVQCVGMLALLIPFQRLYRKYEPLEYIYLAFRISVVGFYVWAGIFKLNPGFNDYIIPYVVSPLTNYLSSFKTDIYAISSAFPYLETLFAVGILIPKISKYSVIGLIGFHGIILLLLGPIGLNTNSVIWIWNLAMIGVLWFGIGKSEPLYNSKFWFKNRSVTWLSLCLFTILPILNFFGLYNKSSAFEIYSGTNYVANLKMSLNGISEISKTIEPHSYKFQDSLFISTYDLYIKEYNLPPNPDPKVIARLEQKLIQQMK
ncbi:MAG: hypothetical protein ACJASM_000625 [Salibacteraceae bacterium]|jgi:hypothetical protein